MRVGVGGWGKKGAGSAREQQCRFFIYIDFQTEHDLIRSKTNLDQKISE
jgi:hypothetical protein